MSLAEEDVEATADSPAINNKWKRDMVPMNKEIFYLRVDNLVNHLEKAQVLRRRITENRSNADNKKKKKLTVNTNVLRHLGT